MLNKEYYTDDLINCAATGHKLAFNVISQKVIVCADCSCGQCLFSSDGTCMGCEEKIKDWLNSEYSENRIHWEQVPVDTPVYLNYDSRKDIPAYFASYDAELNKIAVFDGGRTSFTVKYSHVCGAGTIPEKTIYSANQVTLARTADIEKYYRR